MVHVQSTRLIQCRRAFLHFLKRLIRMHPCLAKGKLTSCIQSLGNIHIKKEELLWWNLTNCQNHVIRKLPNHPTCVAWLTIFFSVKGQLCGFQLSTIVGEIQAPMPSMPSMSHMGFHGRLKRHPRTSASSSYRWVFSAVWGWMTMGHGHRLSMVGWGPMGPISMTTWPELESQRLLFFNEKLISREEASSTWCFSSVSRNCSYQSILQFWGVRLSFCLIMNQALSMPLSWSHMAQEIPESALLALYLTPCDMVYSCVPQLNVTRSNVDLI